MTENSTAGLTMLDAERSVVVTGEERHQDVLCELTPERGRSRRVAIELVPIGPRLEARLDGQRVGELTALMSQRYGPTVDSVLRGGGRPGCIGRVALGKRGVEVELRLPAVGAVGLATEQLPVVPPVRSRGPGQRGSGSRKPVWVGAGVAGLLVAIGGILASPREHTLTASPAVATGTPTVAATPVAAPPTLEPTPETAARPIPTRSARKSTVAPIRSNPAVYYRSCEAAQAAGVAGRGRGTAADGRPGLPHRARPRRRRRGLRGLAVSRGSRAMGFVIQMAPGKAEGASRTGPYSSRPTTQPGAIWARRPRSLIRGTRPRARSGQAALSARGG